MPLAAIITAVGDGTEVNLSVFPDYAGPLERVTCKHKDDASEGEAHWEFPGEDLEYSASVESTDLEPNPGKVNEPEKDQTVGDKETENSNVAGENEPPNSVDKVSSGKPKGAGKSVGK